MTDETRTTIEVLFGKKWEARLLSHLDVMRALSRALRRSGLPIYFTEGFNPKPKVSYLTQPLALGHTSECERFRFMLEEEKSVEEALPALAAKMPPGLEPTAARYVREGEKPAVSTRMEYILFLRKGARWDAPQPPFSMPEEFGWMSPREATPSEIAAARLFDSRETTAPRGPVEDFISGSFESAFVIKTAAGSEFRRPDKIMIPAPPVVKEDFFFHRLREMAE
ncbi:MAG TPA: TIGR03936 family radical SAM-associated protein [bacterium]|nr:TIGR03936 family radical SAM-associated protein [bacterium]